MSDEKDLQSTTVIRTIHIPPDIDEEERRSILRGDHHSGDNIVSIDRVTVTSSGQIQRNSEPAIVSFDRRELDQILRVYGFKVADGEWKDYSIDLLKDRAVFSVYRRAHDMPLHCIEKIPRLARKQGTYSVTGSDGRVLKRGHDLASVLKVLEKRRPKLRVV